MQEISTSASICLIDDDLIYQFTAKRMIQLVDPVQKVLVFSNGKEAIDFFQQRSIAEDQVPDVIFLDINMPIMNGWEFLEAFESIKGDLYKKPGVYMISSSIDENDKIRSRKFESVKDFIVKPINQKMMKEILQTVLPK